MLAALTAALVAVLTLASCGGVGADGGGSHEEGPPRDTTPAVLEVSQPGTAVVADDKAVLDYSNASDGYICVMSNLPDVKVKVLVEVAGAQYQYTINDPGSYITIPLSQNSGSYSVGVWENLTGDSYAAVFSQNIDVALSDEFKPFLYPNQFVDFAAGDEATKLSQQLADGSVTDVDALNKIYDWVSENISYDTAKATTVASGYLPDNTETIDNLKGICFDYAVLTASMLRAQRVPAKLVIGYAGTAYHAWMEVYCEDTGTVLGYTFNGDEWERMDPTFDAATGGLNDLTAVIGDGNNYQPMFYY
ncbi:MAG: transglutaminase-like domain-containing protein [Coriobacteriales bacterium]|nr:transglutaminase-like domain-containing protein [Coriobacteriales bacterium]